MLLFGCYWISALIQNSAIKALTNDLTRKLPPSPIKLKMLFLFSNPSTLVYVCMGVWAAGSTVILGGVVVCISVFRLTVAFLLISAPPRFTRTPVDQTGVSGGVASFICQAMGDPRPKIVWNKKGKKVSNQRFEVLGPLFCFSGGRMFLLCLWFVYYLCVLL